MRHSFVSKSISDQVAPRASPLRVAVNTTNRKHSFAARDAPEASTVSSAAGNFLVRQGPKVFFTAGMAGRAPSIISPATLCSMKPYAWHQDNTARIRLRCFASYFRFCCPYRDQYAQHVFPPYLIDSQFTDNRQDMFFHALFPVLGCFLTAPTRPVCLECLFCGLFK